MLFRALITNILFEKKKGKVFENLEHLPYRNVLFFSMGCHILWSNLEDFTQITLHAW